MLVMPCFFRVTFVLSVPYVYFCRILASSRTTPISTLIMDPIILSGVTVDFSETGL